MDQRKQDLEASERRAQDRRNGDRRGALRSCAGRRRSDRRRKVAGAGLVMAALALLPQLRGASQPARQEPAAAQAADTRRPPAPPRSAAAALSGPFDKFIEEAAALYGVSADLVRAVIQTESRFNPRARSQAGAVGLMQLMPRTARGLGIEDPSDPEQNIYGGVKYLSTLLEKHNGNVALALASYNAGPTNVKRHGGIPPFRETRGYVKKIQGLLADATELPDTSGEAAGD